jgi:hypothetical protein
MKTILRRREGQAVLEYVLLLGVVVLIMMGLMYRFVSSFAVFMDRIFIGEESYFACLIKEGVLPGDQSGTCVAPTWNLADGKALTPNRSQSTPITQAGGSGTQQGGGANSANNQANNNSAGGGGGRAREGAAGGNLVPATSSSGSGFRGGRAGSGSGAQGESSYTGSDRSSSGAARGENASGSAGQNAQGGRDQYVPAGRISARSRSSADQDVPLNERDRKTAAEISAEKEKRKLAQENLETGWDIGKVLRWLLIIALILAIIFFVGTQLVAVARGNRR